ncbi:MAG: glycosyltransferase family 2 protein [Elusimicrobia bacterium]|nr:glycosyltransferase family 2 protein [Elusimicrobiota bacterium]
MNPEKLISFVIAVYRNERELTPTYKELKSLFSGPLKDYRCEFVFVDDGSDDASLPELLALREADPQVRVVSFSRNFGQMAAIIAGVRAARGDAVINKNADMQEPAEAVVRLVREWEQGGEIVLGHRLSREDSLLANVLGNAYWSILKWTSPNLPVGSDFFLLGRQAADAFNRIEESDRFCPVDVLWLGFNPRIVPYHRMKRLIGKSQWGLSRKVKAGIDGILHSSYLPIRFISVMGLTIGGLGFIAAALVAARRLIQGTQYPGWTSTVVLLLLLNGLTMMMLGIIGEYVWRIYNQAKGRPQYIVRRTWG